MIKCPMKKCKLLIDKYMMEALAVNVLIKSQ